MNSIEVGFSFFQSKQVWTDTISITTYYVVGKYVDASYGTGNNDLTIKDVNKIPMVLQVFMSTPYYYTSGFIKFKESELIKMLEEDQKLMPEFRKYTIKNEDL